jgi:hypothetical protein
MTQEDGDGNIIREENKYGVEKSYVEVNIGTSVVVVPRHLTNPTTQKEHDLKELSDDGYLKKFLALEYASNSPSVVDFDASPFATFDKDKWELMEKEDTYVLFKEEAEEINNPT